jgi:hypothetical protein
MALIIFVGSVYLLLAAIFGRRMGYLVLAAAFFGWMIILSAIWVFGVGPANTQDLGPRGTEPQWHPIAQGVQVTSSKFPEFAGYPGGPWRPATKAQESSVSSVTTSVQAFLAEEANAQLAGAGHAAEATLTSEDFTVTGIAFATHGDTSLAAARGFYNGGGPSVIVAAYHDPGSVPKYSWMFLIGSLLGFAVHLPFLDRAERKRKAILTGGKQPPFLGPA